MTSPFPSHESQEDTKGKPIRILLSNVDFFRYKLAKFAVGNPDSDRARRLMMKNLKNSKPSSSLIVTNVVEQTDNADCHHFATSVEHK